MLERLLDSFAQRTPTQLARDALDILLVYYVVYRALLVLRGTRAMQVGVGLGVVFVFYLVAQWLQLVTVLSILGALISSIILVIVVVFQNDIRRDLMRVGSRAWLGSLTRSHESKVIDEVVEAATELARHRIGAIITFEQDANLDEFVGAHKGHVIDATVTRELLVCLFVPEGINKLHDGAVVIRNLRIAKGGVFFPMPEARVVDESFGSRHRAALGITEETDAVVVVVSEERGTISFCFNGNIASNLDGPKLRAMLEAIFSPKVRSKKRKSGKRPTLGSVIAEAEAPVSTKSDSDKTAPESTSRTPEPPPASEKEEEAPVSVRERESEPPAPLRPRVSSVDDAPASVGRVSTVPLRPSGSTRAIEIIHTPLPRVSESPRIASTGDEDADDDGSEAPSSRGSDPA
jgi:uncharacterized protein (TIGR00159 family)